MALTRIWIHAVPILCLLGIGAVVFHFLRPDGALGASRHGATTGLVLLTDKELRHPIEAPDVEHEAGVIGRFQRRYGERVRVEYGTAAELFEHLSAGRGGDVYLTGEVAFMDRALEAGLVGGRRYVARRIPVILVRSDNPLGIESVEDLVHPDLRLGVAGEPSGLIGRITAEILEEQGLPADRLADSTRFTANSAIELAGAVERNRVDAAIVWRNVGLRHSRNTRMIAIPEEDQVPAEVQVAVVTDSPNAPAASQLADFLAGGASGQVFELYGFAVEEVVPELTER